MGAAQERDRGLPRPRPTTGAILTHHGRLATEPDEQLPALRRLTQPVALVVCAIGGNGMYRSTSWQIRDRFTRLVAALPAPDELAPGQRTVLATLPQGLGRRRVAIANAIVQTLAPMRGIEVADLWATTGAPWHLAARL